jgi:hypothetical protein
VSGSGRANDRIQPVRRGLFGGGAAPPMDSMPRIRTAFARGLIATWSSPLIVGATLGWLLVEWLVLVAFGYPGPVAYLAHISAVPPLSTNTDLSLTIGIFGSRGLALVFVIASVHALWLAIVTGLAIDAIETGTPTRWAAIRGLRAFPVTFALHVIGIAVLFSSQLFLALGGGSLGFLVVVAILVFAVWALAFAPVIAIAEQRRLVDCLGRALRAARMPGSGNLTFAALYAFPVFATLILIRVPGSLLDVSPPYTAWIFLVTMNLLHIAVLGAFAMRYLSIASEVPDPPPRRMPAKEARSRSSARPTGKRSSRR